MMNENENKEGLENASVNGQAQEAEVKGAVSDLPDDDGVTLEVVEEVAKGKPKRGVYLLPNLFTTAALFSGFYAIVAAMNGLFEQAAVAIFISMIFDGLDGRVARMTVLLIVFPLVQRQPWFLILGLCNIWAR